MAQNQEIQEKVEATWDIDDPIFTARERVALEMASMFTEDYRAITDNHVRDWKEQFSDVELVELGTFMALADGFGKLVELVGLGEGDQACAVEI